MAFMGFDIDSEANQAGLPGIERAGGEPILIIPAAEERMTFEPCLEFPGPPR